MRIREKFNQGKEETEKMLRAIIKMSKALTENGWEGNRAKFVLACEDAGIGDLAYQLWADCRGGDSGQ